MRACVQEEEWSNEMEEARELVLRTCEDLLAGAATGDETNEVAHRPRPGAGLTCALRSLRM